MTLKILNLYAGIGGNRKLWSGDIEVTAVENNESIAKIYQDFFPNDKVIIADAHQYLLEHYKEFDFIWSSPPCPTHSRLRLMGTKNGSYEAKFPDMRLYEEIIFLDNFFEGKWVVENVISYYEPLIKPTNKISRHFFWSNFFISIIQIKDGGNIKKGHSKELQRVKGWDISNYKIKGYREDSAVRSIMDEELGLHIFNMAFKDKQKVLI
jgi:DNA (cytosine-5)-methyltransferase 1